MKTTADREIKEPSKYEILAKKTRSVWINRISSKLGYRKMKHPNQT